LAAAEHVLYREFQRAFPDDRKGVDLQRGDHQLMLRVRLLEQACTGGPMPPRMSLQGIRDAVVDALIDHVAGENVLIADLLGRLSEMDAELLAARYDAAFRHGPTRPHLHGAHRGALEPVTFAFGALRDRILDVLDARTVAVPRAPRRPAKSPGMWGRYLLGASTGLEASARHRDGDST
jgi:hypothetical protein